NYLLKRKGATELIQCLSLNYNRQESATACYEIDQIESALPPGVQAEIITANAEQVGKMVLEKDEGTQLWKLAVLLALLFVAIEILLLRFLKTA
ncbi:MAG: hypothetical protein LPK45_00420, partial [Bacteroidota bacterium]|nr:hypothetical protein [Bacteroidota bacterium]MDX5429490.1 hypothetical protein [Bacteroidota bacterium]MDX5468275.1 hypothetical protein [Bacteroidota bacterium]